MATDYSTLKTEIADFAERNDLSSVIDTFIDLCESEMQRELKLLEFETTGTVTVTSGSGTLPTGFIGARALSWDGDEDRILRYITPDRLNTVNASNPSLVHYYTITGDTIKFANDASGTLNITYMARFTPLSNSNTTNAIITNHPAAYLYGSLKHLSVYLKDAEGAMGYDSLFKAELAAIKKDTQDRRYAGASLAVVCG
ncbi:MAG TPA: hypothetical protein PLS35_05875 [Nitrospira sp.]|nr:hypothetical protein [Nitrospira sp.]HNI18218.1 hypothetical protein [Nitrospira sp.]